MRKMNRNFLAGLIIVLICGFVGLSASANAQARKVRANFTPEPAIQQPLYTEYRGVRLGMTATETRAKLGEPAVKADDGDYYILSDKETVQLGYDVTNRVTTISIDFVDGVGAPDHKAVVGGVLEQMGNGGFYKLVRYESQGFWVSYNRSVGAVVMVTITIQKM